MTKDSIRIGIVGTGSRGVSSFGIPMSGRTDVQVTALCDPNPVRLRIAQDRIEGNPSGYGSIEDMLAGEPLDAVMVTSPDCTHAA